ncbi:MAG: lysylphosphatidylglycerol synthase transmembrane domain-containing protein [Flavipsychrobacter sp.]|nr:lysylphosphatidylglycerol synthase transmembrane domain-containing protein [Flavipsychrobacter sp.]
MILSKSTKIWLNYTIGAIISVVLLYSIWLQVTKQLNHMGTKVLWQLGPNFFLYICLCLMPVNVALEAKKWQMLAGSAQPLSFRTALAGVLAGIAFSIVTPNRIGEYPGRILYLKRKNTFRLISVSILGAVAQMFTLFLYGLLGLVYYNLAFPGKFEKAALVTCFLVTAGIGLVYWRFENWLPLLHKIKWFRKFRIFGQLLKRFTNRQQFNILGISILRFGVFTAQYLFLSRWMNVDMPLGTGFCMAALFFWVIAIVPSIALAELGERGQVSLYLFHHLSPNTVGILGATIGIWMLNLIIPSVIGSILLVRMKLLR